MTARFQGICVLMALAALRLPLFAQQAPASVPDPLSVSVNLSANAQPIQTLLEGLNAANRPHLQAKNGALWERVSVYGSNIPLRKVMQGLHLLLNYPWIASTTPPAGSVQTLTAAPRMAEYEKGLWEATLLRGAAPLFTLPDYLQTSAETYRKLNTELQAAHKTLDDPLLGENLQSLMSPTSRLSLELLPMLTREQRLSLLEEGYYVLPPNAANARQQQILLALGYDVGRVRALLGKTLADETPEDSAAAAQHLGLIMNVIA